MSETVTTARRCQSVRAASQSYCQSWERLVQHKQVLAATIRGGVYLVRELRIVRLLFEGNHYSRAATIRGRRLFEEIWYCVLSDP